MKGPLLSGSVGLAFTEEKLEKMPLSLDKSPKSHGAIENGRRTNFQIEPTDCRNSSLKDAEHAFKEGPQQEEKKIKKDPEPMSALRKFFFFMSFNVWIVYFAVFLWIIPCRKNCTPAVWTIKLDSFDVTSNLEAVQDNGWVVFGFSSVITNVSLLTEGNVAAFHVASGVTLWNRTLPFLPRHLKCYAAATNDKESECIAADSTNIAVFNASDGTVFWHKSMVAEEEISPTHIIRISCDGNASRLVYAGEYFRRGAFLTLLEAESGSEITSAKIPCDGIPLKLLNSGLDGEIALLLCKLGASTNMWMVSTHSLCATPDVPEMSIEAKFHHMYELDDKDSPNIAVPLPSGKFLIAPTTNALLLVSGSHPSEMLWRMEFNNSNIVDAAVGHFSSAYEDEIAVLVDDLDLNTMVYVLKMSDGNKSASASVPGRKGKSLLLVPGRKSAEPIDSVLVGEEESVNVSTRDNDIFITPLEESVPLTAQLSNISYFLVEFAKKTVLKIVDTSSVKRPTVVTDPVVGPVLLVTEEAADGASSITGYLLDNIRTKEK